MQTQFLRYFYFLLLWSCGSLGTVVFLSEASYGENLKSIKSTSETTQPSQPEPALFETIIDFEQTPDQNPDSIFTEPERMVQIVPVESNSTPVESAIPLDSTVQILPGSPQGSALESASELSSEATLESIAPSNPTSLDQLQRYGREGNGRGKKEQVTSVSQLSDVQPTDWAFQALQSLVERYGCIAGYPDGTVQGQSSLDPL